MICIGSFGKRGGGILFVLGVVLFVQVSVAILAQGRFGSRAGPKILRCRLRLRMGRWSPPRLESASRLGCSGLLPWAKKCCFFLGGGGFWKVYGDVGHSGDLTLPCWLGFCFLFFSFLVLVWLEGWGWYPTKPDLPFGLLLFFKVFYVEKTPPKKKLYS